MNTLCKLVIAAIGFTFDRYYFHLDPCARCGTPSFQQPCPYCSFYPYYGVGYDHDAADKERASYDAQGDERFQRWTKAVKSCGGIAQWYVTRGDARTVKGGNRPDWVEEQMTKARECDAKLAAFVTLDEQCEALIEKVKLDRKRNDREAKRREKENAEYHAKAKARYETKLARDTWEWTYPCV